MKNKVESPNGSAIKKHMVVYGVDVTIHEGRYFIHTDNEEKANLVQKYLLDEGVFVMVEE